MAPKSCATRRSTAWLPATRKALMLRFARAGAARLLAAELAGVVGSGACDGESE